MRVPSLSKGLAATGTVIGLWLVAVTGGAALTSFDDSGYQHNDAYALGGGFTFNIRGRADRHEPVTQGDGFGLIDCGTGKLKEVFIFDW